MLYAIVRCVCASHFAISHTRNCAYWAYVMVMAFYVFLCAVFCIGAWVNTEYPYARSRRKKTVKTKRTTTTRQKDLLSINSISISDADAMHVCTHSILCINAYLVSHVHFWAPHTQHSWYVFTSANAHNWLHLCAHQTVDEFVWCFLIIRFVFILFTLLGTHSVFFFLASSFFGLHTEFVFIYFVHRPPRAVSCNWTRV